MDFSEPLREEERWTTTEKKAARRAFDKAFGRHCVAITAEARRMLEKVSAPADIWRVQEYLYDQRKMVDRIYDYRYSRLLWVFSGLLREGWLKDADLTGLRPEKIAKIKLGAGL